MNCFLNNKPIVEELEKHNISYVKSVLGMNVSQNSDRPRLILNKPMENHQLWVSLMKTIKKYEKHFNEIPTIFDETNRKYSEWLIINTPLYKIGKKNPNFKEFKNYYFKNG